MSAAKTEQLRILIANERLDRLETLARLVETLGHTVVAREVKVSEVASRTDELDPDVALVAVGESEEHALDLVTQIVRESSCPVIAVLGRRDPDFVREASRRGLFGYVVDADPDELQAEMEVSLRRFGELQDLEAAFERRAITERAKGILMAQHQIGEREAFELLRAHARSTSRKLVDVAAAVEDVHVLFADASAPEQHAQPTAEAAAPEQPDV